MKFVVPLTIPWTLSIGVADRDSSSTRTTGTAPATAASKRSLTPCSRAVSNSSSPCWESSCLLALTTSLPARIAVSRYSRAGSIPPISSTSRSESARIPSKLPLVRVSTPVITGVRPLKRSISPALSASSLANSEPTVPCPSRPTRNGVLLAPPALGELGDIASGQLLEALAPDDHARVTAAAEDHGGAGDAVVVAGHRVCVGAGDGRYDHIARAWIGEQDVPRDHVAGLAVLARQHALGGAAEAIDDVGLVACAVEHRAQVVRHAPVDGDPPGDVLLDALHRVEGDPGVGAQGPAGLDHQPPVRAHPVRPGALHERPHVFLDRRGGGLILGVANA